MSAFEHILTVALMLAPATHASGRQIDADARRTMAELLKISPGSPDVAVQVVARRTEDGLTVEEVAWPSLDGQRVAAVLIRPDTTRALPAIVCLHETGGSRESITAPEYGPGLWPRPGGEPQRRMLGWARELARRGFVTLAFTQRGLDLRAPPDTNDQAKDLIVRGRTLMGAIVHEIRQAITYLERRADVQKGKIGVTGMSFGGITAFYAWAVDGRITAAASICGGVGSIDVLLRSGRPSYHGFYWWLPGMLTYGDQADFAAALAPRPLMVWAPQRDIGMPKEGVDRFRARVAPAYARLRAEKALVIHQPDGEHEFTVEAFEAMTSFFDTTLRAATGNR
jgi:dienelactone hydrolase